jgi:hypothetical protein
MLAFGLGQVAPGADGAAVFLGNVIEPRLNVGTGRLILTWYIGPQTWRTVWIRDFFWSGLAFLIVLVIGLVLSLPFIMDILYYRT